jgi:hypothetical protein
MLLRNLQDIRTEGQDFLQSKLQAFQVLREAFEIRIG